MERMITGAQDAPEAAIAPRPLPELMRERIEKLASVRRQQVTTEGMLRAARLEFEDANKDVIDLARSLQEEALELELQIKAAAAKHYKATQDKAPCAGVGIRVGTAYDIDSDEAWDWIRDHKMEKQLTKPAQLDEKAIAKLASATELPFVTALEQVTPTIAKDLDKALAADERQAA